MRTRGYVFVRRVQSRALVAFKNINFNSVWALALLCLIGSTGLAKAAVSDPAVDPPKQEVDWEALELPFSESDWQQILAKCGPEKESDPFLYWEDFKGAVDFAGLKARYKTIYEGERRLKHRAFYDPATKGFRMPWAREPGRSIYISKRFIRSVIRHVEIALQRGYADAIMFSDMGHNHFNIPEERYKEIYSGMEDYGRQYEMYFADPTLLMAYHTAEQLETAVRDEDRNLIVSNDRHMGWRYYTRNLVGDNDPRKRPEIYLEREFVYNTIKSIPGYKWGAGIDLSANKSGCFPFRYEGKTYYFDISLEALQPDPDRSSGAGGDYY